MFLMLNIHPGFHSRYKTNHLDTHKSVCEWVCALWDGILQSTYTHTVLRVTIKRREAVSHFSHQQSIVLKKQKKVKKYQPLRSWLHTEWKRAGIIPGMWGCYSNIFGCQTSDEWCRDLFLQLHKTRPWICLVSVEQVGLASVITRYSAW